MPTRSPRSTRTNGHATGGATQAARKRRGGSGGRAAPQRTEVPRAPASRPVSPRAAVDNVLAVLRADHDRVLELFARFDKLKSKGVDEIVCISANDAFVMGAWARDQKTDGKVRMLADGSADYCKALGLTMDLNARGMGMRCARFSMLVEDGVVKTLNIEAPGKFEVSNAETMLTQLG